jgi:hypothetical protein
MRAANATDRLVGRVDSSRQAPATWRAPSATPSRARPAEESAVGRCCRSHRRTTAAKIGSSNVKPSCGSKERLRRARQGRPRGPRAGPTRSTLPGSSRPVRTPETAAASGEVRRRGLASFRPTPVPCEQDPQQDDADRRATTIRDACASGKPGAADEVDLVRIDRIGAGLRPGDEGR